MADKKPELVMRFASGSVKHFGLQMYSTPAPSIAEMIANAWDADATELQIDIPLGQPITPDMTITITDNGHGMSADDCNERFLVVGRETRKESGERTPQKKRQVLGRKGLGKFAPFGIASIIEVRTVRDGHMTEFRMDYEKMQQPTAEDQWKMPYEPEVLAWGPVKEPNGTTMTLKNLRLKRAIPETVFRRALERRFSLIGDDFSVVINDKQLRRYKIDFEVRIPATGWSNETLPDGRKIRWWVAFAPTPLPMEEFAGVSVLAHGKLVQEPFFFNLAGGAHAQHGMRYMAGVVEADYLDEDVSVDVVATDRSTIRWDDPLAEALLSWGQAKIKEWLTSWGGQRAEKRLARLKADRPKLQAILDSLEGMPASERDELRTIVIRLAASVEDDDRLVWAVESVEAAYGDRRFIELARAMGQMDEPSVDQVLEVFREFELLESARLAQITAARLEVVKTFERLIDEKAPEKAPDVDDMQGILEDNPWLLNPDWQILQHERAIDTILVNELNLPKTATEEGKKRLDFFCLADSRRAVVVEVKRPGHTATLDEWNRFVLYVSTLRQHYERITKVEDRLEVEGLFVATKLAPVAQQTADDVAKAGIHKFTDWTALVTRVIREYRAYFDALVA
ncbi:MAG: ATP-binding protein, partial [Chloroflexi bacterium]|nr:ATP-binding protein [Chloroflexota bacterium]